MRIHGLTIPSPALTAGREAMVGNFSAADVASAIYDELPGSPSRRVSYEAANRMLQAQRKDGRIFYDAKTRTWGVR